MQKKFVAKNGSKFKKLKVFLWIGVICLSFVVTFNILFKIKLNKYMMDSENQKDIVDLGLNNKNLINIDLISPKTIFKLGLHHLLNIKKEEIETNPIRIIDSNENDSNPLVYIYNTHENETYDSSLLEAYNISYTVGFASYILRDYLKSYGISVYTEKESMTEYLAANNLLFQKSYDASRYYMQKRMRENPSLKMFIDIHRDSVPESVSTVSIDKQKYAKILFVIGTENKNYNENLKFAEELNAKIDKRISRGILKKSSEKGDGIYNQDLSKNAVLIEVGGMSNSIIEVNNTMKVLAKAIFEYLNGE